MFEILVVLFIIIILIAVSSYIDKKKEYTHIALGSINRFGEKKYFSIPYYIWQTKKACTARSEYPQNRIIHYDKYEYVITSCTKELRPGNENNLIFNFVERELWFWVEPLNIIKSRNNQTNIYQNIGNNDGIVNVAQGNIINMDNNVEILDLISNLKSKISNKDINDRYKEDFINDLNEIHKKIINIHK
ncbi:hypothetical protein CDLVIII_3198 [Clostridium sp. DL-VIII]|uniref:hypothetical protein n=1 Tax=Clostridium sp. DL-VIII TaxID=641107 RepID=UPI00023AFFCB|nr:hypothetical protein [Clostridium sp. DL-VIII]EHI99772.1 hypothetical protein CDLVIII_3198 [Clostridium sp. DL-VIII]